MFNWTGTSKKKPNRFLPWPGDNFAVIDLGQVGVRLAMAGQTPLVQFAINTFGKRAHPNYPAEFDIYIDANRDGIADYILLNWDLGSAGGTGTSDVFYSVVFDASNGSPLFAERRSFHHVPTR